MYYVDDMYVGGGPWVLQSIFLKYQENYLIEYIQVLLKRNKEGKHSGIYFIVITRESAEQTREGN